jgi:methylase of polypeptide subunit release factors
MQPLLPENESRNGTGAICLVQAKSRRLFKQYCTDIDESAVLACPASIPLSGAFR